MREATPRVIRHYGTTSFGTRAANKQRPERRPLGSSTRCERDSRKPQPPRSSEATVEAPTAVEATVGATVEAAIETTAATPPVLAPVYFDPLQIGFRDGRGRGWLGQRLRGRRQRLRQ